MLPVKATTYVVWVLLYGIHVQATVGSTTPDACSATSNSDEGLPNKADTIIGGLDGEGV